MEEKQSNQPQAGFSGKYLIALLFIFLGSMLLGRNIGLIPYGLYNTLVSWYSLLFIIGIYALTRFNYLTGIILSTIGGYYLIINLFGLRLFSHDLFWPLALIILGIYFLTKKSRKRDWADNNQWNHRMDREQNGATINMGGEQQNATENGFLHSNNSFSGVRHVILDEVFKGATVRCSFGGTSIDLRHTHIEPGTTYINVDCSFSGVELYVPSDWKVVMQCNAFFGGCQDKRYLKANIDQEHILVIRGNLSFAGLEIKD